MVFQFFFTLIMIAMIIIYGFLAIYYNEIVPVILLDGTATYFQSPISAVNGLLNLIMDTLFTLLGFGLLLSGFKNKPWFGMATALFIMSFNIIVGLLLQDMWFEILFSFRIDTGYIPNVSVPGGDSYQFWLRHQTIQKTTASYYSFRLSNLCSTAYLVGMTAFSGRITFNKMALSLPIFSVLYYLNLYLNDLVCYSVKNKLEYYPYLDTYGTTLVYLFGAIFGLVVGYLTRVPRKNENGQQIISTSSPYSTDKTRSSLFFSLLGAFFLISSFLLSYTDIITPLSNTVNSFGVNSGAIMVLFGIAAGIIGYFATDALLGKGKINIDGFIIGSISGGIIVGNSADVIQSIGATLFLGFIAGAISAVSHAYLSPKLNKDSIIDNQGLLGPFLIISVVSSFVVFPSILSQFYNNKSTFVPRGVGYAQNDPNIAAYQLSYFGITVVISAFTGLIIGLINKNHGTDEDNFSFSDDFGLYDKRYIEKTPQYLTIDVPQSSVNITPYSSTNLMHPQKI